jgi:hypothetical protein
MNKNILFIGFFMCIISISGCIQQIEPVDKFTDFIPVNKISDLNSGDRTLGQTIKIQGIIKTGSQINRDYCSKGFYLTDNTGVMQLVTKISNEKRTIFSDRKYLGKNVEVMGKYPVQESFCEALLCECEDFILVENIKIIEKDSRCEWKPRLCKNICISENYYFDENSQTCTKYIEPGVSKGCCSPPPFETIEECQKICE